ncbi:MAG: zinc-binding dehydrogenase [Alphaproteobacteria bacterium]
MRALMKAKEGIAVREVPAPRPGDDEVLIRVMLAGLCRTDVFVAEGRIPGKADVILGHEFSGIVEQAGMRAGDLKQGDRVTAMPVMPCGRCDICASGLQDRCQSTTMLGIDHDGAFSEYIAVPASAVYKIPDTLSFRLAAYSEPVAAALSVMKSGIAPEQRGVIYGNNRFGHLIDRILKAYGFGSVTIFDPAEGRPLRENAYDFAIETLATEKTLRELMVALKPGGKIVLKSRKHEPVGINLSLAVKKEVTLTAVNYGDFAESIRLMAEGLIQVDDLLGTEHTLEEFAAVFERSKTLETQKVFFNPGA